MISCTMTQSFEDDVFNSRQSARRHWSVTSSADEASPSPASSLKEGIFHRAMSRRRTLEEDELFCCFDLPPLPLDDVSDSDVSTSHDSRINLCKNENSSSTLRKAFVNRSDNSTGSTVSSSTSSAEVRSARKVPFTKSASAAEHNRTIRDRLKKIGKDFHSVENSKENADYEEVVSIGSNGVSIPERKSKSLISDKLSSSDLRKLWKIAAQRNKPITVYPGNRNLSKTSLPDWQLTGPPPDPVEPAKAAPVEAPPPKAAPDLPSSESGSEISDPITGCEISVGESRSMTLSNTSDVVAGVETAIGPDRPMSPEEGRGMLRPSRGPVGGDGEKRSKRSVRDVFKMGFLMSKKNKRKPLAPSPTSGGNDTDSTITTTTTTTADPQPPPRVYQRRVSRLEMNIPIEEVFSGIKFATIDHKHQQRVSDGESQDDSDVIEDLDDCILMFQEQSSQAPIRKDLEDGRDYLNYEDVFQKPRDNILPKEISGNSSSVDFT